MRLDSVLRTLKPGTGRVSDYNDFMAQRLIIWVLPNDIFPPQDRATSVELTPEALANIDGDFANKLGNSKVISHSIAHVAGGVGTVVSFVVEDVPVTAEPWGARI